MLGAHARLLQLQHDGAQARHVAAAPRPEVAQLRHARPLGAVLHGALGAPGERALGIPILVPMLQVAHPY